MRLLVLPLRIPVPCDLHTQLSEWLDDDTDESGNAATSSSTTLRLERRVRQRPKFSSNECTSDFNYLVELRQTIGDILSRQGFEAVSSACHIDRNSNSNTRGIIDNLQSPASLLRNKATTTTTTATSVCPIEKHLREYAAVLRDCEERGFPISDGEDPNNKLHLSWKYRDSTSPIDDEQSLGNISNSENNTDRRQGLQQQQSRIETHHNLRWERANVVWNLATLEAFKASETIWNICGDDPNAIIPRAAWTNAGQHLQNAANLIRYLRKEIVSTLVPMPSSSFRSLESRQQRQFYEEHASKYLILSPFFLEVWERFCTAEAQRAVYETFRIASSGHQPRYFLLAKLAAAASPLYQYIEEMCQSSEMELLLNTCSMEEGDEENRAFRQKIPPPVQLGPMMMDWEDTVRAWGIWMSAVTEYNQSIVHREEGEYGNELARLDNAIQFGCFCREFCENGADSDLLDSLAIQVMPTIETMEERYEVALRENRTKHRQIVPSRDELPDIQPQLSVTTPETLEEENEGTDNSNTNVNRSMTSQDQSRLLPASNRFMFLSVLADPMQRKYADIFRREINYIIDKQAILADEETERARQVLASMQLPHSLTIYKQELQDAAAAREEEEQQQRELQQQKDDNSTSKSTTTEIIPDPLWERIEQFQQERWDERVKDDLRYVRHCAEQANTIYRQMQDILDEDLQMDIMFREQNPSFYGHSVKDIQKSFRSALQNYSRLLMAANESDTILQRRCDILDSDPRFRLLKLSRSQLNRVIGLPTNPRKKETVSPHSNKSGDSDREDDRQDEEEIDVSILTKHLVDLSLLFNERESLVYTMREMAKTYKILSELQKIRHVDDSSELENNYRNIVDTARESFKDIIQELHSNMDHQNDLLHSVAKENDIFVDAWEQQKMNREQKLLRAKQKQEQLRNDERGESDGDESYSFIVKIEDSLAEVNQFVTHLKEGREFYDLVIPKLNKLKIQVDDASTRLTVERSDHESREHLAAAAAAAGGYAGPPGRVAAPPAGYQAGRGGNSYGPVPASASAQNYHHHPDRHRHLDRRGGDGYYERGGGGDGGGRDAHYYGGGPEYPDRSQQQFSGESRYPRYQQPPHHYQDDRPQQLPQQHQRNSSGSAPHSHPGAVSMIRGQPEVRVDDEKVASLVAMDFDPVKVVAALKKYNNDVEQALNDLLCG